MALVKSGDMDWSQLRGSKYLTRMPPIELPRKRYQAPIPLHGDIWGPTLDPLTVFLGMSGDPLGEA